MIRLTDDGEELVPLREAARLLGISVRTAQRWARAGRLGETVAEPAAGGVRLYVRRSAVEGARGGKKNR